MPTVGRTLMLGASQEPPESWVMADLGRPFDYPDCLYSDTQQQITANAAGEGIGAVFQCPVAGTLDRFQVRFGSLFVAGDVTGRVETVSTSTGINTGTLVAAGAEGTMAATGAAWNEFVIGTPPTVAAGDMVALIAQTVGSTVVAMLHSRRNTDQFGLLPYITANTSGSWGKFRENPMVRVMISGAWVPVPGTWPNTTNSVSVVSTSPAGNPDEVGNLIQMPATMRCCGARFVIQAGDNRNLRVRLYDAVDTVLREVTLDGQQIASNGTGFYAVPWEPITLTGGEFYRLTVESLTGSAVNWFTTDTTSGFEHLFPGGGHVQWIQRVDAGAWSQTSTRIMSLSLLIDGVMTPEMES